MESGTSGWNKDVVFFAFFIYALQLNTQVYKSYRALLCSDVETCPSRLTRSGFSFCLFLQTDYFCCGQFNVIGHRLYMCTCDQFKRRP